MQTLFIEKQRRLLMDSIYNSWSEPKMDVPFLAAANVGIFVKVSSAPLVPDIFLSLDTHTNKEWGKQPNWYLCWEHGKPPDLVIEIVSNGEGAEMTRKLRDYSRIGIPYYVIFDPAKLTQTTELIVYGHHGGSYTPVESRWLELVQLGLTIWEETYEFHHARWLRWVDREGNLIPTGRERAERERERAERERERAERLLAQLRAAGIEPEN